MLPWSVVWTDPPGVPRSATDSTPELVNDLDLRVIDPAGNVLYGNESLHPHQPDRLNNVEVVSLPSPAAGSYTISIDAARIAQGPRQSYALVITGDIAPAMRARAVRR